jgi:membrane peptidoglycan carboxypeptidase
LGRLVLVIMVAVVAAGGGLLVYASQLPNTAGLPGEVRAQLAAHDGTYAALSTVPLTLRRAIVAVEDDSFYSNPGVSLEALGRAMANNIALRRWAEGGSTISQQLVKVVYLDGNDRSGGRKLNDMLLALQLNHRFGKDQILELYLNAIYYGHGAYGVQSAARTYFHRPLGELDVAQCALLAGLPQAPSLLDPFHYPARAASRRSVVLDQMVHSGVITAQQARTARAEPLLP